MSNAYCSINCRSVFRTLPNVQFDLSAKIINGYKSEFKTPSNIWKRAFPQVVSGYRGQFRLLPNIYGGASVFLRAMINLTM